MGPHRRLVRNGGSLQRPLQLAVRHGQHRQRGGDRAPGAGGGRHRLLAGDESRRASARARRFLRHDQRGERGSAGGGAGRRQLHRRQEAEELGSDQGQDLHLVRADDRRAQGPQGRGQSAGFLCGQRARVRRAGSAPAPVQGGERQAGGRVRRSLQAPRPGEGSEHLADRAAHHRQERRQGSAREGRERGEPDQRAHRGDARVQQETLLHQGPRRARAGRRERARVQELRRSAQVGRLPDRRDRAARAQRDARRRAGAGGRWPGRVAHRRRGQARQRVGRQGRQAHRHDQPRHDQRARERVRASSSARTR